MLHNKKITTITNEYAIWGSNTVKLKQKGLQNVMAAAIWLSSRQVVMYEQFSYEQFSYVRA